jgi:hypothetical protein
MKVVLLPVTVIAMVSSFCCCCGGGGDWQQQLEEAMQEAGVETPAVEGGTAPTDAPAAATSGSGDEAVLGGTCGKFKELGVKAPSGLSVFACTQSSGTDSLMLRGDGDPGPACATIRDWATGAGFTKEFETESSGTTAITMTDSDDRMSIACTTAAGATTVAVSITPK